MGAKLMFVLIAANLRNRAARGIVAPRSMSNVEGTGLVLPRTQKYIAYRRYLWLRAGENNICNTFSVSICNTFFYSFIARDAPPAAASCSS